MQIKAKQKISKKRSLTYGNNVLVKNDLNNMKWDFFTYIKAFMDSLFIGWCWIICQNKLCITFVCEGVKKTFYSHFISSLASCNNSDLIFQNQIHRLKINYLLHHKPHYMQFIFNIVASPPFSLLTLLIAPPWKQCNYFNKSYDQQ